MTDINTPTGWNEELKSRLEGLTPEQKDELLEILKKDKLEREKSAWNEEAILEDLKENHVKVEENKEMLGHKWKIIHIDLPAVWEFGWFKFDCFVSDLDEFIGEVAWKYEEMSYEREELYKLQEKIFEYGKACWAEYIVDDWDFLNEILWLDSGDYCWLKTKYNVNWKEDFMKWNGFGCVRFFDDRVSNPNYTHAKLLLKVSD